MKSLVYVFYKFVDKLCSEIEKIRNKVYVDKIRSLPGVELSLSFSLGKNSTIDFKGTNNKLSIGDRVRCKKNCTFLIYPNAILTIEKGVFFNNNCSVTCLEKVHIGENTLFGEGVKIYDHNHAHEQLNGKLIINADNYSTAPVIIGSNSWIGSNVTILKGVTIGNNVIVGANCLVYASIPDNSIVTLNQQNALKIVSNT